MGAARGLLSGYIDVYLNFLHLNHDNLARNFMCLAALFLGFHLLSYAVLRLWHTPSTSPLLLLRTTPSSLVGDEPSTHLQSMVNNQVRQPVEWKS